MITQCPKMSLVYPAYRVALAVKDIGFSGITTVLRKSTPVGNSDCVHACVRDNERSQFARGPKTKEHEWIHKQTRHQNN